MAAMLQSLVARTSTSLVSRCSPVLARAALHVHARTVQCRSLQVAAAAQRGSSSKQAPLRSVLSSPATKTEETTVVLALAAYITSWATTGASFVPGYGQIFKDASDLLFESWGLLAPTRRNYTYRFSMSLAVALKLGVRLLRALMDCPFDYTPAEDSNLLRTHPRYLGTVHALVQYAESRGGELSTAEVRKWLTGHPDVLHELGLKASDIKVGSGKFHIDHVQPHCKGGLDHPMNYIIMEASANLSFGGGLSLEKCIYVGPATLLAVIMFHAAKLPSAGFNLQAVQLTLAPVYGTLQ